MMPRMQGRELAAAGTGCLFLLACGQEALVFPAETPVVSADASVTDAADAGAPDAAVSDTGPSSNCEIAVLSSCNGACVDLQSNPSHCGACGVSCTAAAPFCESATCVATCSGSLTACGAACVNLGKSVAHCGACGAACPPTAQCANARCVCPQAREVCGTDCVDVKADARNCGACGVACGALEICAAGRCKPAG